MAGCPEPVACAACSGIVFPSWKVCASQSLPQCDPDRISLPGLRHDESDAVNPERRFRIRMEISSVFLRASYVGCGIWNTKIHPPEGCQDPDEMSDRDSDRDAGVLGVSDGTVFTGRTSDELR